MKMHIHTPLLLSHPLSRLTGNHIYLKCDNLQPSGSFKDRGIGALCQYYAKTAKGFVSSSGGNAGMAVAFASQALSLPAIVIVPKTTPLPLIEKIKSEHASVIVSGENWDEADAVAQKTAKENEYAYIPPFDHPIIWQGYGSLVEEIKRDNIKPDALVVAVGGGGLFCGMVQGLRSQGWDDVAIITSETQGAASLYESMKAKKRIHLPKVDTIATTLAAKQICEQAFIYSQQYPTFAQTVSDKEAVKACISFANDHRFLVEPACGAALAVVYEQREIIAQYKNIVVIVCGGSGIDLNLLAQWKTQFQL